MYIGWQKLTFTFKFLLHQSRSTEYTNLGIRLSNLRSQQLGHINWKIYNWQFYGYLF